MLNSPRVSLGQATEAKRTLSGVLSKLEAECTSAKVIGRNRVSRGKNLLDRQSETRKRSFCHLFLILKEKDCNIFLPFPKKQDCNKGVGDRPIFRLMGTTNQGTKFSLTAYAKRT